MARLTLLYGILLAMIPIAYSAPTGTSSLENVTISVPDGTTNHGDPQVLCTPSQWTDVVTFFLANFFAHVATVKSRPGEPALRGFLFMLLALFFPTSGVKRGLDAIFCHAIIGGSPLQRAKKAGALCEVIRTHDWKPRTGDVVRGVQVKHTEHKQDSQQLSSVPEEGKLWRKRDDIELVDRPQSTSNPDTSEQRITQPQVQNSTKANTEVTEPIYKDRPLCTDVFHNRSHNICIKESFGRETVKPSYKMVGLSGRKIHGLCCLPQGFGLSIVPSQSTVLELNDESNDDNIPGEQRTPSNASTSSQLSRSIRSDISSSYSFAKGIIAIFQTLYASATLYRTKGDQIERYGYAAFGLTVAPYLVMSIINLTGAVLTPDYPTLYMVESEIMEEASRRKGAYFGGTVGNLKPKKPVTQSSDASFEIDDQNRTIMRIHHFDSSTHVSNGFEKSEEAPKVSMRQEVLSDQSLIIAVPECHDVSESAPPLRKLLLSRDGKAYRTELLFVYLTVVVGMVPVAIIGILSRFKAGKSTQAQRFWTMTWLAFGIYFGPALEWKLTNRRYGDGERGAWMLVYLFLFCGPAIVGFVVVGQMLMNYGRCIQISGGSF